MLDVLADIVRRGYDLWPSYGFAVLITSLAVGALFLPFMIKQARSAQALASLQPQVERINRDHAGDRKAAGEAIVELYRRHGVTSAVGFGCLFFALQLAAVIVAVMVMRGLTTLDPDNGGGPRYIDQGTALWQSLKQDGGQLPWFGVDLGRNAFTGPDSWISAMAYLVLPTAFAATGARGLRRQSNNPAAVLLVALLGLWIIALLLPGAVVLYLLTITALNGFVVALTARSGTFRKSIQEADRLESTGDWVAAAVLRLDAVTTLLRTSGTSRLVRFAGEIHRNIVAATAERPSDALAVFAELRAKSPGIASEEMIYALVLAWARSTRVTRFANDLAIITEALESKGKAPLKALLDACQEVGSGKLTPGFRSKLIWHLRDYLHSTVNLASDHAEVAVDREAVAFQLLSLVLPRSLSLGDLLCALGDLALAKEAVPEGLARYRAAAEIGSREAIQRLAYHEVREGHRLLSTGDIVGAQRRFRIACELHSDPEYVMLWTIAGVLNDRTDYRAEFDQLAALGQRGVPSPDITFWRAIAHARRGERQHAAACLRQLDGPGGDDIQGWGLRQEGVVLLALLEGDDSALVEWARRLTRMSAKSRSAAGLAHLWTMLAAVARGERGLLADMVELDDVADRMPPWGRIAGAHALLTRSAERASKGFVGEAAQDAQRAQRLLKSTPHEQIGSEHQSCRVQLGMIATGLRAALAKSLSSDEAAYAALVENGERHPWTAQAEDIWAEARGHDPWRQHHLAVLHHARAYDLEIQGSADAHGYWTRALEHWRAVHKDGTFWEKLTLHLGEHMGTDIDPGIVAEIRKRLPRDLLEPHRDLIAAYRSGESHRARSHMRLLLSAPFASDLIDGVRAGLVRDVVARVPQAIQTASYEPMLVELGEWLSIDPENAHLFQAVLTVTRSSNERLLGTDDDFMQIERNVRQTEQLVRPTLDAFGSPRDHSQASVQAYVAKLENLRPAVPSCAALIAEIARHEFWNGLVSTREVQQQFSSDAGPETIRTCERVAAKAIGHFALARLIDPQLTLNPFYQHMDVLDCRAETVLGLCFMLSMRSGRSDPVSAAQHFRRATTLEPSAFDAHLLLGQSLFMSGDTSPRALAEAEQAADRAEELLSETSEPETRTAAFELKMALLRRREMY